jgi:eukaryotic-like serine/threonine-protein kinase
MHFPARSHVASGFSCTEDKEVSPGDEPRTVERESMSIPEPPELREEAESAPIGSKDELREPLGVLPATESPTVHRGSTSSARKRLAASSAVMPAPIALPNPGDTIDGFVLEESIGVGGMGAVYRAHDTKLDRWVALKLLPPDQATDAEVVPRFYQEGRSAARLDHENIARVFSIGQDGPFHYIAFEFIDGVTIRHRVETEGALPVAEAVHVALQIGEALVHASQRGVVHRDIKPSNIIITPSGRAKLVDMGLARRFERGGDTGLTQSGMTLGTFDYISPEQARDPRDVDVRSDLYSLGCTLFQMLTGRPPFPGGTVLQKLIQHQEDAPADVRMLNPAVPVELANIIAKLMAKDRDRRYQTPENLVRDLLGVAGSIGLATSSSVFPGWHGDGNHAGWERHLIWLVPALGLIAVVAGLAWWGSRELAGPRGTSPRSPVSASVRRLPEPSATTEQAAASSSISTDLNTDGAPKASPEPAYIRIIPVNSNDDLLEQLATAPRRSVILLSDDGPFQIGGRASSFRAPAPLSNVDLTIRAEKGVRPMLKFATDALLADRPPTSLLHFIGGHVTIEDLEFELDAVLPEQPVNAVRADGTELTLRGCSFRRTHSREGRNVAALQLRAGQLTASSGDRPATVFVDSCHFDGGQAGIRAEGPTDLILRDCTLGPGQPSIWFDNSRASSTIPGAVRITHSSVLTGSEPVFRFDGTQVRVSIDDSVIAPAGRSPATLVLIDNPRDLSWHGRFNLYAKIGVYLGFSNKSERQEPIVDFAQWIESATDLRETDANLVTAPIWDAADPSQALQSETDNPSRAFLLSPSIAARFDVGARRGPFGSILKNVAIAQRARPIPEQNLLPDPRVAAGPPIARRQSSQPAAETDDNEDLQATNPMPLAPPAGTDPAITQSADDPGSLPTMPPMPTAPVASATPEKSPVLPDAGSAAPDPAGREDSARKPADLNEPARAGRERGSAVGDEDLIRGGEQFLAMFHRLGSQGGTLRIAAGAELELPTILIEGTGQVQLIAEAGARRPRLRFRPSQAAQRSPADWTVLFNLVAGSLHLQGIDLVVPDQESLRTDRLAAVGVVPGTELSVTDCTLTLAVDRPAAALFVVQPEIATANSLSTSKTAGRTANIRIRDSFLRSGGEGVAVTAGRRLELELSNVVVSTEASLLHAFGSARQGRAETPAVSVNLDRVTAIVKGGLIHLDSTPEEPELPFAAVVAENAVISTANRDEPLFRLDVRTTRTLDGQDQLDNLADKIRWQAKKVAYDRIKTYRRDEVARTGVSPRIYDRANWTSAFLPKDESPLLGDVKFVRELDPAQAAWKLERDDLSFSPKSALAGTGADVGRIPQPPLSDEL